MKIVTWNINSIRMRMPRLLDWLARTQPDVVCLQETKVVNKDFPLADINAAGYQCFINGQKTYNGVAILTRHDAENIIYDLPGDPAESEKRLITARINGIQIINVYVPNGSDVGSEKYHYKLAWYQRLRQFLDDNFKPEDPLLICGDFNVALDDRDVWDVAQWKDQILFSEPEKAALHNVMDWGLTDALRMHHSEGGLYTWWDYRNGAFHRGWGLRIDHFFISEPLKARSVSVEVDRNERKGEKPSDHAPVIAVFN